jgi:ribosomal protein L11 methylase PrmA
VALNRVEAVVRAEVGTVQIPNIKYQTSNAKSASSNLRLPTSNFQFPASNLVVANILAETIVELAPALAAHLLPGGVLIASGIIAERAEAVVSSLRESGLSLVERHDDGDWLALVARQGLTADR